MFLDSNVLIHGFLPFSKSGVASNKLLERIIKGEQKASLSPLVLDEVFFTLSKMQGVGKAKEAWKCIIGMQNLDILPVDRRVASFVLEFVDLGLEPRDAFHAATMKANGISTICSYDKDFDRVKSLKRQEPK